jgi:hypothetical protein
MLDDEARRGRQSDRLYETGPFFNVSQAINCLATIIQSLRDLCRDLSLQDNKPYTGPRFRLHIRGNSRSRTRTTTRTRTRGLRDKARYFRCASKYVLQISKMIVLGASTKTLSPGTAPVPLCVSSAIVRSGWVIVICLTADTAIPS